MKRPMDADEFKSALAKLELTQGQAGTFLERSIRAINGYANGAKIDGPVGKLLRLMIKRKIKPEEVA